MAMDTSDLNYPMALENGLAHYAKSFLQTPPNFTDVNKMFSNFMANPGLMRGPSGGIMDPRQTQNTMATNFLNERGDIANQNLMDKDQMAQLLLGVGGNIGNMFATQTGLNAQQIGSGGGIFGGLI